MIQLAFNSLPNENSSDWVHYRNDCERKRTTNKHRNIYPFDKLEDQLHGFVLKAQILSILGISEPLEADGTRHGSGIHVSDPGDYLQPHIDYAKHPHLPDRERRLNAILWLNNHWKEAWGGAYLMCDDMGVPQEVIYPKPNRLILWEPSDIAFHGTSMVVGPYSRVTFAAYYLAPLRPGVTRKRALFVPKRF